MKKISAVIPVYNSEPCLDELCRRLSESLKKTAEDFEIILVDDNSRDHSWDKIETLFLANPKIRGIRLTRNCGQHNALLCGIRQARHAIIITLDDDLQNPPEEIEKLLAKMDQGFDVVYGTPEIPQHSFWRNQTSVVTKIVLQKSMEAETARHISSFRAFRTEIRNAFACYSGSFVNIDVLLTWGASKFSSVFVRHNPRTSGASQYTLGKLMVHSLNMITGFSTLPLQLASFLGFALTFFGCLIFIYVMARWLIQGSVVPGFPFLASIIAIFSGAQLFALGIIGEYLARIYFLAMKKPSYVIGANLAQEK